MSNFTRENFSYPKIAIVIGTGVAFIVLGVFLGSEKGIVIGPIITGVGLIYLLGRFFVDLTSPKLDLLSLSKLDSNFENGVTFRALMNKLYSGTRDIECRRVFDNFLGRLEHGRYYEEPREEVEAEYKRLATLYKDIFQECRQIEFLRNQERRKLSRKEKKTYLAALEKISLAIEKARPQQRARDRILRKVWRARSALKNAVEPDEISKYQEELELVEAELENHHNTEGDLISLRWQAWEDLATLEKELLNKWVPLESVSYPEILDKPMPDPKPPASNSD